MIVLINPVNPTGRVYRRAELQALADLAIKLERLAVDSALRARIAKTGSAWVTTAFDWDRAVRRMEEILAAGAVAGDDQARRRA